MTRVLTCAVILAAAATSMAQPSGKSPAKPAAPAKQTEASSAARERVKAILAAAPVSFDSAASDAQALFDQCIAYAPEAPEALAEADFAIRLLTQLKSVPQDSRRSLLEYLLKHESLARTLAFLVKPQDDPKAVYAVLSKLISTCAEQPGELPNLAAAVCAVHDRPVPARASFREGDKPRTIDPVEVFRFFASNESKMVFSPRTLPAELQVYLVDSTAEPSELAWALSQHAGDRNPGKLFNQIVYDSAALKYDKPKKISTLPYTLENIRKVGGVCEEQAYFASSVGKAIGVPSVMIVGRSSELSHAWDGLLVSRGNGYSWDLDEGCFGDYKKLRGNVVDPQTGERLASQELNLLAASLSIPEKERREALACADAGRRLAALSKSKSSDWPPKPPEGLSGATPKPADMPTAMAFLERAVKLAPTSPAVWSALTPMARDMTDAQRIRWSEALLRTCEASPDFIHRTMGQMIAGLEDPREQAQAWAWAAERYPRRADLRALALIAQGGALEKAGDKSGAFTCYQEVAEKLINDAPEAVGALDRAESLLKATGKPGAAIDLYAAAFRRVARPANATPGFFRQSNFYRVGERYATLLEDTGRASEAKQVRSQLKQGEEKDKG